MQSTGDNRKRLATTLADSLYSATSVTSVIRLLTGSLLVRMTPSRSTRGQRTVKSEMPAEVKVGIWEAVDTPLGREFRRAHVNDGARRQWADVESIPPKRQYPRVVLIGESVARGALCEPHLNPASVLREH